MFLSCHVDRTVTPDIFSPVGRGVAAGSVPWSAIRSRPGFSRAISLLVEGLLGDAEGVDRRGHATVENHLRDNLGDLLLSDADVQRARYVPLDHLGAVPQHDQSGDGAEATRPQVDGRAVVYLAIDDSVNEAHDFRGQLGHGRRRLWIVCRPVVAHPELRGSIVKVCHEVFLIILCVVLRLFLEVGLVGTQVRVIFLVE